MSYRNTRRFGSLLASSLVASLFAAGCQGAFPLRWPSMAPEDVAAQRRNAERFDPYPDSNIGPSESLRPRDGQVQRSEPRRIRENSVRNQGLFPTDGVPQSPTDMPSQYQVVPQ